MDLEYTLQRFALQLKNKPCPLSKSNQQIPQNVLVSALIKWHRL